MATERRTTPAFERLLAHLTQTRGFDVTAYKRPTLASRIDKRLDAVGAESYDDYVDYLEVHPDEFGLLFNSILLDVTTFFRDPDTFDCLKQDVIPALLRSKPRSEPIRVWSAGCASGEECYSIAMLLAEALGPEQYRERVKIYATDVDEEELAQARQAVYTDRRIEDVPAGLCSKYFDRSGPRWTFKKDFRRNVIFGRHDLRDDAPISKVDVLVCRNTLIYFNQETQAKIASRFHFALRDGGYLVLGRAEMLDIAGAFTPVDLTQRVFVKVAGAPGHEPAPVSPHVSSARLRDLSFDQDSAAQLLLDAAGVIVMANARARELLGVTPRDVGRPLKDLAGARRPVDLRPYVDAHAPRHDVHLRSVAWPVRDGASRYLDVQVSPMSDAAAQPLGTKIVFTDVTRRQDVEHQMQRVLTAIGGDVPLGVVGLDARLHVEIWNGGATELLGLRPIQARGREFFDLEIGLPLERLRAPIAAVQSSSETSTEVDLAITNRRGRRVRMRVLCARLGTDGAQGRGVLLLMHEIQRST